MRVERRTSGGGGVRSEIPSGEEIDSVRRGWEGGPQATP